jgi:hypothetical protein
MHHVPGPAGRRRTRGPVPTRAVTDPGTWTTVYPTTTGTGGATNAALNRPVSASSRENAGTGGTRYGYPLREPAIHPLGPNVIVFDPSMSGVATESKVDSFP